MRRVLVAVLLLVPLPDLSAQDSVSSGLVSMDFDLSAGDQQVTRIGGAVEGRTYELQLNTKGVLSINGWSVEIDYNTLHLRYVDGSFQATDYIPEFIPLVDAQEGKLAIGGTVLGSPVTNSDPGALATLAFEVLEGLTDSTHLIITANEYRFEGGGSERYEVYFAATIMAAGPLFGDFDKSGKVNFTDFFSFADAFGSDDPLHDLDGSGIVDFDDFFIFADNFGKETGEISPSEPDPSPDQPSKPEQPSEQPGEGITVDLPGGVTMDFMWIEPGTFSMGSPLTEEGREDDEGPQHAVTITQGVYLGKYEITQGQWEGVMGTTPWAGMDYVQSNPNHPAVYISWEDVQAFIRKLNQAEGREVYRLPTEAEWEYACRAGTSARWSFGDDESLLGDYAWYKDNAWGAGLHYAQPVGTRLPNPWGLYDMYGNVYEWCQDWYGDEYYRISPGIDPLGPADGSYRVLRGGSVWHTAQHVRSADRRGTSTPGYNSDKLGARLLKIR